MAVAHQAPDAAASALQTTAEEDLGTPEKAAHGP